MKKSLLTGFFVLLLISTTVFSQKPKFLGVAFEGSVPTGDFSDQANTGYGASAMFLIKYRSNIDFYGSFGVISWDGESIFSPILRTDINFSFLGFPLKAGARYRLGENKTAVYLFTEAGIQFFRSKSEAIITSDPLFPDNRDSRFSATNTTSNVLIAPGVGFQTPLTKKIALDLSARFEIVQDSKYFGVRAGFTLPIGSREE